jgi:hypothetical protein
MKILGTLGTIAEHHIIGVQKAKGRLKKLKEYLKRKWSPNPKFASRHKSKEFCMKTKHN